MRPLLLLPDSHQRSILLSGSGVREVGAHAEVAVEGALFVHGGVQHVDDVVDGHAGLRDVGGQHDLALPAQRRLEDAVLLLGSHLATSNTAALPTCLRIGE